MWYAVLGSLRAEPVTPNLSLGLACVWIAALPSARDEGSNARAFIRRLVPAVTLLQALIAYPVAGTQLTFGSVLLLMCGAMCVADGWHDLQSSRTSVITRKRLDVGILSVLTACTAVFAYQYVVRPTRSSHAAYAAQETLQLPGADRLHLPRGQAETLQQVVATLRRELRHRRLDAWNVVVQRLERASGTERHDARAVVVPPVRESRRTSRFAIRNEQPVSVWSETTS